MKEYLFSVIMAVYNVETFLAEAIDSLIAQDIGFEKYIQLVLVDDGSSDGSGAICDSYAQRYPENIIVCHKENGGVSSARNLGLTYATGKYLNFMDSDDKLSEDTMTCARNFFAEHEDETDVAAFQMQFFDGQTGDHILSGKFRDGTRVIYLEEQWDAIQMSSSCCFIRAKAAKEMHFCENLAYAEDAREVNKILLQKKTLGIMAQPVYWYRKRSSGVQSALQASTSNKRWYHEYLQNFSLYILEYAKKQEGYIPLFLQNTVMHDLQWRLKTADFPAGMFSQEKIEEYWKLFAKIMQDISDEVILQQQNIFLEHKAFAFRLKYGNPLEIARDADETIAVLCGGHTIRKLSEVPFQLQFIKDSERQMVIEGAFTDLQFAQEPVQIAAKVNGQYYPCQMQDYEEDIMAMGRLIAKRKYFVVTIPLAAETQVHFCTLWDGCPTEHAIQFGKFCPVSHQYAKSYSAKNDWILSHTDKALIISKNSFLKRLTHEAAFCKEILQKKEFGFRKAIPIRFAAHILRLLKRKPIWLVSDRAMKADDNGEAFFTYMQEHHKREIRMYFALDRTSSDFQRIKQIGSTLHFHGFAHKVMILIADYVISSSGDEFTTNPFYDRKVYYKDLMKDSKYVFLQHGVIKDDLSGWLTRYAKNIDGFITSATPEWNSIVTNAKYAYPPQNIWLTGLPRFDRLYNSDKKVITIAPTWRKFLMTPDRFGWQTKPGYKESHYYKFYNSLLSDQRLLDKAKALGYTLAFMPHPNVMPFVSLYQLPEDIKILGLDTKYRDMYAMSSLILTDYSSAVFDFAYLRKPVLYAHFDYEEFRHAGHVYTEGYFDYERDGFGEVEYDLEGTVDRIIEYMENGCQLKDKYRQRIDSFFAFNDKNNCERIYQKIMALESGT